MTAGGDKVLAGRPTEGLDHAALDLAFDLLRVDRLAHVVDADDAHNVQLAGLHVHLDLDGLGDIAIGKIGRAVTGVGVDGRGRGGQIGGLAHGGPFSVLPALESLLGRVADGVAGHKGHARGRNGTGAVRAGGGVGGDQVYAVQGQVQRLGGHLADHGVGALADFGGADVGDRLLDLDAAA